MKITFIGFCGCGLPLPCPRCKGKSPKLKRVKIGKWSGYSKAFEVSHGAEPAREDE